MTDGTQTHAPDAARGSWGDVAALLASRALRIARAVVRVIRPVGWVLIAAAVLMWIAGLVLGWQEVRIAAVIVTATIALCALFLIGRTTYDVSLDLNRSRVVVGERAVGALTLSNPSSRAILPSRVVLPVGSGRGVFGIGRLAPGESVEELFAIPTQRRAVLKVGPVSIVRGDPLGLFERVDARDEPADLYVHPRTVLFGGQSLGFMRDLEGMTVTELSRDDIAFHALSEYRPGDDLRHVHWRSTARTGTVMVRQYEQTRRSHFVIGLSCSPVDYRSEDEFELAISVAGSIGLRALRDSFRVDMRAQGGAIAASSPRRLLDSLSGVEHSRPREGGISGLGGEISAAVPLASVVVLVCGSTVTSAQLRTACSRLPHDVRSVVVTVSSGADSALRRIGDADVVTVGRLDDLPATLRRVLG